MVAVAWAVEHDICLSGSKQIDNKYTFTQGNTHIDFAFTFESIGRNPRVASWCTMSVHYKFKSSLDFDTISFDGLHISVADLKKEIINKKKLGKTQDFDLQITNAQTKEGLYYGGRRCCYLFVWIWYCQTQVNNDIWLKFLVFALLFALLACGAHRSASTQNTVKMDV